MKKLIFFAIMVVLLIAMGSTTTGCTDKKPTTADSTRTDTIVGDTATRDTLESIIEEQPMPKAADELFDDFVFNFAANRKLQFARIKFPLDVYQNDKVVKRIEKKDWRMEHFFMKQGYYTLIFDNAKQMNLVKDTTIGHVVIEKIAFNNKSVKQFLFNRVNGQWMLTSMNLKAMYETTNASFYHWFYFARTMAVVQTGTYSEGRDLQHHLWTEVHGEQPQAVCYPWRGQWYGDGNELQEGERQMETR